MAGLRKLTEEQKKKMLDKVIQKMKTCQECQGNPNLVPFATDKHKGMRCDKCWDIPEYEDVPQKTQKKK